MRVMRVFCVKCIAISTSETNMREPPAIRIQNFRSKQILCKVLSEHFHFHPVDVYKKAIYKCFIHIVEWSPLGINL